MDGPAGAGKGTLAKRLAAHLGYAYLETGLLYRAVGLRTLRAGADPSDVDAAVKAAKELDPKDLEDSELRGDATANTASIVAAYPEVRKILIEFQRGFAAHPPGGARGAVIEGRDIGTVVCPNADIKFFVTASVETRANRRLKELLDRGIAAIHSAVLRDMKDRDSRDSQREAAPLRMADDAILLDTTELTADQVFAAALKSIESRTGS
ncbi:MAG: (d)CMP kinase [Alphaproteobacteria bacterium]